jgi:molecular chaperone DnaK (HSP70)
VQVTYKSEIKSFLPEEILAILLITLKNHAETFLGQSIFDAVITIPVHFSYVQRQSLRDTAKIAGLNIIRMVNQSTSTALYTSLNMANNECREILVFNIGGGSHSEC